MAGGDQPVVGALDHQRRGAVAREPFGEAPAVQVWRAEADARGEAEQLVAQHLLVDVAAQIGEHGAGGLRLGLAEQQCPERRQRDPVGRMGLPEHVGDRRAGDEQPGRADQREAADALRVAHRDLGRDPAADAGPGEAERPEPERVEQLEIVEHQIVDGLQRLVLRAPGAAGMGGRDQRDAPGERLVERQKGEGRAVDVGDAVQVDHGRAVPRLGDMDRAPPRKGDLAAAHSAALAAGRSASAG
ncbi:MAG: hypothetical protein OXP07_16740 [Defluviicoccus sp.]|nr:hypothetical protein [Defluviicoccus sp.]